jgi:surface protein
MDSVTMVLIERDIGIPLDLVVVINSYLYEKLTDENFKQAISLWFRSEEECKWRFGHISDWNTSRVTNMKLTFHDRLFFNEDLSRWNVSNVTSMSRMFEGAKKFNADISRWNVKQVTDMSCMFSRASEFNGDLSRWDVSSVTDMSGMFCGASQFTGIGDLSRWNVNKVLDMKYMFHGSYRFNVTLIPWCNGRDGLLGE